jgi:AraC-like DNA-binding protein
MLLKYITLISCFNSLLMALALLFKRDTNSKARNLLSTLFVIMSVYSALIYIHYMVLTRQTQLNGLYMPIDAFVILLIGPCLYFYVLSVLLQPLRLFAWRSLLHFIPLLLCVFFIVNFCSYPYSRRLEWLIRDFNIGTPETKLINIVLYLQILLYLSICYRLVKKQLLISNHVLSANTAVDIAWLKTFLRINLFYIVLSAPLCFYFHNEEANIIIGQLAVTIQFMYLFFKYILKHDIPADSTKNLEKDSNFKIQDAKADEYLSTLLSHMESNAPYRLVDCNIQLVAEQTGIPTHYISIVLNTRLKQTFPNFINKYRVEKAQVLLCDQACKRKTIESIGADCGFGSKATFNRVFRKYTANMTPTEYRRSCVRRNSDQSEIA